MSKIFSYTLNDLVLYNLRWFLLLLVIVLVLRGTSPEIGSTIFFVIFTAFYNLLVLLLSVNSNRAIRMLQIILDLLIVWGGYGLTGGDKSVLFGLAVFPAISTTILFDYHWGFALGGLAMVGNWLLAVLSAATFGLPDGIWRDSALTAMLVVGCCLLLRYLQQQAWVKRLVVVPTETEWQEPDSWAVFSQTLLETSTPAETSRTLSTFLDFALDVLKHTSPAPFQAAVLLADVHHQFYLFLAHGFSNDDVLRFSATSGVLYDVQQTARSQYRAVPAYDPELSVFEPFREFPNVATLPLVVQSNVTGLLLLFGPPIAAATVAMLEVMRIQTSIALQQAANTQALQQQAQRMHHLQEEARRYLARNLHDGPTQQIAAITMKINLIKRKLKKNPDQAVQDLQKLEDIARQTTQEVRYLLFTMRPLALETQGLSAAIVSLANKMRENYGLAISVELDATVNALLPQDFQVALFWITEEALRNAHKHASPSQIWVRLWQTPTDIVLQLQDNGVGFDLGRVASQTTRTNSLGLVNMRERAELLGGTFTLQAAEGKGTLITVTVPKQVALEAKSLWQGQASEAATGSAFGLPIRGD